MKLTGFGGRYGLIDCPRCGYSGIPSAIIPDVCTECANKERGIVYGAEPIIFNFSVSSVSGEPPRVEYDKVVFFSPPDFYDLWL